MPSLGVSTLDPLSCRTHALQWALAIDKFAMVVPELTFCPARPHPNSDQDLLQACMANDLVSTHESQGVDLLPAAHVPA